MTQHTVRSFGPHDMFCPNCKHVGKAKKVKPGSFLIEIILWLAFLIPGIIYSIWRVNSTHRVCELCNNRNIIPANSPEAQRLLG